MKLCNYLFRSKLCSSLLCKKTGIVGLKALDVQIHASATPCFSRELATKASDTSALPTRSAFSPQIQDHAITTDMSPMRFRPLANLLAPSDNCFSTGRYLASAQSAKSLYVLLHHRRNHRHLYASLVSPKD